MKSHCHISKMASDSDEVCKEIRQKALGFCQEYLGGMWSNLKDEDFSIKPISGGLSNLLYLCQNESDKVQQPSDEPSKVLFRLFGPNVRDSPELMLNSSVLFALLSEKGIGPKIYGVFLEGRLEEFIQCRTMKTTDIHKSHIYKQVAQKVAQIHSLEMPLSKKPDTVFKTIDKWIEELPSWLETLNRDKKNAKHIEEYESFDLVQELHCLRCILNQVNSPVRFCHNDVNEGNMLQPVTDDGKEDGDMQVIDFEYSGYNHRAYDFGNFFNEWCMDYSNPNHPYYFYDFSKYPSVEQQKEFYLAYISETGKTEDVNAMVVEGNVYALKSNFYWGLWSINMAVSQDDIQFDYLLYGIGRFKHYFHQKAQLPSHITNLLAES